MADQLVGEEGVGGDADKGRNLYEGQQGLKAVARLTGLGGDDNRGSCKKCGRPGHMSFQCRNMLQSGYDEVSTPKSAAPARPSLPDRASLKDEDSESSDLSSDSEEERKRKRKKKAKKKKKEKEKEKKKSKSKHKKKKRRKEASSDSESDSD
ncbi:hypothetical protein CYMTET_19540 [Cymbomonas tetramitiformis]|uniref:CCHC-type domain-containing protein n=1 Tax=Cymbomonas tetramitiformis TaxID=36881 RepID=A0AAE0L571_9CHLO|nr:hypothetical protein CYMTET_19540 [Cymbomonas tetramitiformis]